MTVCGAPWKQDVHLPCNSCGRVRCARTQSFFGIDPSPRIDQGQSSVRQPASDGAVKHGRFGTFADARTGAWYGLNKPTSTRRKLLDRTLRLARFWSAPVAVGRTHDTRTRKNTSKIGTFVFLLHWSFQRPYNLRKQERCVLKTHGRFLRQLETLSRNNCGRKPALIP